MPDVLDQLRDAIRGDGRGLRGLGRACGVSAAQLSRFVCRERDLKGRAIAAVCRELGLRLCRGRLRPGRRRQEAAPP